MWPNLKNTIIEIKGSLIFWSASSSTSFLAFKSPLFPSSSSEQLHWRDPIPLEGIEGLLSSASGLFLDLPIEPRCYKKTVAPGLSNGYGCCFSNPLGTDSQKLFGGNGKCWEICSHLRSFNCKVGCFRELTDFGDNTLKNEYESGNTAAISRYPKPSRNYVFFTHVPRPVLGVSRIFLGFLRMPQNYAGITYKLRKIYVNSAHQYKLAWTHIFSWIWSQIIEACISIFRVFIINHAAAKGTHCKRTSFSFRMSRPLRSNIFWRLQCILPVRGQFHPMIPINIS